MNHDPSPSSTDTPDELPPDLETASDRQPTLPPDLLERIEMPIAAISLGLAAVLVVAAVVLRYAFHYSHPAFDEITRYAIIWGAFVASSRLLRHHGHITIDVLLVHLPDRWRVALQTLAFAAGVAFCLLLVWHGLELVVQSYTLGARSQSSLRVPMWLPQLAVPAGGALLLVRFIQHLVSNIRRLRGLFHQARPGAGEKGV